MRLLEEVAKDIWKLRAGSNLYLLKLKEPIIIDTGMRQHNTLLTSFLDKVFPLSKIKTVIFTHLHYDHIGNFDLFPNASFYASEEEIASFKRDPKGTVLDTDIIKKFNAELHPVHDFGELYVVPTPGHTAGSICLWYKPLAVLFSGDTLFGNKKLGRADFPTSSPEQMNMSMMKLINYNFRILCPGHDY